MGPGLPGRSGWVRCLPGPASSAPGQSPRPAWARRWFRVRRAALVSGRAEGPQRPDWLRLSGKTQLAVAAAESLWQSRSVDLLVWAVATSRTSVLAAYAEAAAAISGTSPAGNAELVAARFVGWLNETGRPWLLVLDDLSSTADLRGLWPEGRTGRVLLTTADSAAVPAGTQALPVGMFSNREALNYLMGRLSTDPDRRLGAIDLVKDLGCEPVALVQACAVITSSAWTCRDYHEAFVRRREQMTDPSGARLPAAAVTWTFCFEQADWLSPDVPAQSLLALVALLDGHGIPAAVLSAPAACGYLAGHRPGSGRPGQRRPGTAGAGTGWPADHRPDDCAPDGADKPGAAVSAADH